MPFRKHCHTPVNATSKSLTQQQFSNVSSLMRYKQEASRTKGNSNKLQTFIASQKSWGFISGEGKMDKKHWLTGWIIVPRKFWLDTPETRWSWNNKRNFKNFLYKPIHDLQTNTRDNLTYLLEQSWPLSVTNGSLWKTLPKEGDNAG